MEAKLIVGAQCGHAKDSGAFTGDIPMKTLKALGCSYVLCGHSERRQHHGETDAGVAAQVGAALGCGLIPILCIGETEEERASGTTHEVLKRQLSHVLRAHSLQLTAQNVLIAYEPVWAIGSGATPSREEIKSLHAFIRSQLNDPGTRILYGGSVKPENAEEILSMPDVDGSLIGGASLKPEVFRSIGDIAARLSAA
jgi:triosephosphate isomerase (TIM)